MPLDNTASIKDIITSLQNMEGINAKADLASVVGSPATADDSMATINNAIQQAKNDLADKTGQNKTEPLQSLVNNMVVGKKWASGNSQFGDRLEVRGLAFAPSIVFGYTTSGSSMSAHNFFYYKSETGVSGGAFRNLNNPVRLADPITFHDDGFNVRMEAPNNNYNWVAFE